MTGSNVRAAMVSSGQGSGLRGRHPVLFALLALDLGLVSLQYGLGMYVNLYVQIPSGVGMSGLMMGIGGLPALVWHMMNGWLLGLVTLVVAVVSLTTRDHRLMLTSWTGLVSVAAAGTGGMLFIISGGQNGYSYLMALGALGALVSLSMALFLVWNGGTAHSPPLLSSTGNTLELLDTRYARGEIGREEYLRAKHDVTET